jgi:hypothetical protein
MPSHEHLVRCGGLGRSAQGSLQLDLHGPKQNVTLKIEDIVNGGAKVGHGAE